LRSEECPDRPSPQLQQVRGNGRIAGAEQATKGATVNWKWDWDALVAIGTLALAISAFAAIFASTVRRWWNRPVLTMDLSDGVRPDFLSIPFGGQSSITHGPVVVDSYYVRFRVVNKGLRDPARNVMAFLAEVNHQETGTPVDTYIPLHLNWSNFGGHLFYPMINRGLDVHCDLGFILDPQRRNHFTNQNLNPTRLGIANDVPVLALDTVVKPNSQSSLIPPGTYILKVIVAASNAKPATAKFQVIVPDRWYPNEDEMFSDVGLSAKITEVSEEVE